MERGVQEPRSATGASLLLGNRARFVLFIYFLNEVSPLGNCGVCWKLRAAAQPSNTDPVYSPQARAISRALGGPSGYRGSEGGAPEVTFPRLSPCLCPLLLTGGPWVAEVPWEGVSGLPSAPCSPGCCGTAGLLPAEMTAVSGGGRSHSPSQSHGLPRGRPGKLGSQEGLTQPHAQRTPVAWRAGPCTPPPSPPPGLPDTARLIDAQRARTRAGTPKQAEGGPSMSPLSPHRLGVRLLPVTSVWGTVMVPHPV